MMRAGGTMFSNNEYHSFPRFDLALLEVDAFKEHLALFEGGVHEKLSIAIDRIVDASIRTKRRDILLDAVSGLESILLHDNSTEQYKQELRFRFSLRYALLSSENQRQRFKNAQSIYDLRSSVSHGGDRSTATIDGQAMPLENVAVKAIEMLRETLLLFIGQHPPDFTKQDFWNNLLFNEVAT